MIILFIIFYIFCYLICSKLIRSTPLRIITFISILITLHFVLLYSYNYRIGNIQKVDSSTLYNNLKNGDIVFTCNNNLEYNNSLLVFNHGISHPMLIVEKDGVKYALHSYPSPSDDYKIDEQPIFGKLGGYTMKLFLEPLMLMVLSHDQKMTYQVFRSKTPRKDISIKICNNPFKFNYCSKYLHKTLIENNFIKNDSTLLGSYQPDQLIHQFYNNNVKCFYMRHE